MKNKDHFPRMQYQYDPRLTLELFLCDIQIRSINFWVNGYYDKPNVSDPVISERAIAEQEVKNNLEAA